MAQHGEASCGARRTYGLIHMQSRDKFQGEQPVFWPQHDRRMSSVSLRLLQKEQRDHSDSKAYAQVMDTIV